MSASAVTDGTRKTATFHPDHGGRKLRIGLFADSPLQPHWIVEAFARIATSDFAEIVAIAEGRADPRTPPWLWRAYGRVDTWLFGSQPNPSEHFDLKTRIPRIRMLSLPDRDAGQAEIAAWGAELAALRLDVAFALGDVDERVLEGVANYGVWRYCFGEERGLLETLAGFREVIGGAPVTASGLIVRRAAAEERLVYQSWSRTFPFSVARNRENFLCKTAEFAARALKELHRSGEAWLEQCTPLVDAPPGPAEGTSATAEIIRGLSKLGGRIARRGLQKLFYVDQWVLAYRFGSEERWQGDVRRFTRLMPPKDRYWADPFPIERDGRHFVFFEELVFATGKGHIAMVELGRDGACSAPVRVLERDYHLSYPFLIELDGQLYMVPETGENRTVELYRCTDFPNRWRLEKVLLRDAWFVDATIHRTGDRWWMFVNVGVERGEPHDELHLFHADHLLGEWQPHPCNPVKSDVRCARPAGQLYQRDGILYRPAQICAPLYGSGVLINRVLHLSPQAYLEQEDERILPMQPEGLLGIHTLNRAGELSVIDGFMRRPRVGVRRGRDPSVMTRLAFECQGLTDDLFEEHAPAHRPACVSENSAWMMESSDSPRPLRR
jgi:hypothetical protein